MHLKCPRGHSRLKHGLHSMSILAMRATGDSGGVYTGDDEPNSATSGTPTAAAACMRPESLLMTSDADDRMSIVVPRSVRPVRSRTLSALSPMTISTASDAILSFGEPTIHTCSPSLRNFWASSANWFGGQRLAAPNSAPGQSITTGRSVLRFSARMAPARLVAFGTRIGACLLYTS